MKTLTKKIVMQEGGLPESLNANQLLSTQKVNLNQYQDLMTIKRARQEENRQFKTLFFYIGLTLSLLFVTVAINWKTYDKPAMMDLGQVTGEFEELLEIPPSEQLPPPPPPQNITPQIVVVEDDAVIEEIKIELDMETTEETVLEALNIDFTAEQPEEEKVEEIFTVVENFPQPIGGMSAFYEYVGSNIVYPNAARRLGISGVVFVRFVVEKDGKLTDIQVVRGIGAGCDEEAIRVLSEAPAWQPGNQRGRPVRVLMTVPIRFILKD